MGNGHESARLDLGHFVLIQYDDAQEAGLQEAVLGDLGDVVSAQLDVPRCPRQPSREGLQLALPEVQVGEECVFGQEVVHAAQRVVGQRQVRQFLQRVKSCGADVRDLIFVRHEVDEAGEGLQRGLRQLLYAVPRQHELGQAGQVVKRPVYGCELVVRQVQNPHLGHVLKHVSADVGDPVGTEVDVPQAWHVAEGSVGDVRDAVEPQHDFLKHGKVLEVVAHAFNLVGLEVDVDHIEGNVLGDFFQPFSIAVESEVGAGARVGAGV